MAVGSSAPQREEPVPYTPPAPVSRPRNVITVNVSEWFQSTAFSGIIKFSHWPKYERRVEQGIHLTLSLLRKYDIKATFFILGIVAREFPEMVKMIAQEGHEIGTMGYYNRRLHEIPPADYIKELEMSIPLLKSLSRQDIVTHRAPEWSVTQHTLWVMDALRSFGVKYDSSIYPVNSILYGIEDAPRHPYILNPSGIIEFPPTTYRFAGKNVALFGGTNLRVSPYSIISMAMQSLNNEGRHVLVHVYPWEMEGEFPRFDLGFDGYMQQYAGLKNTFSRISGLCQEFTFDTISGVLAEDPPAESVHINTLSGRRKENLFQ
jgi:polysaccharide deacetylase family protein (PEP-CTERM system associated)